MNPEEYLRLDRIDRTHWFYCGKRAIVRHWIDRYIKLGPQDLLIDAGMGTGVWLRENAGRCRVLGLDDHEESIALAGPRLQEAGGQVMNTSLDRVDLPDGCASVVTMLDVLEHLDDDAGALREMVRLTRPGGLIVITVPAFMWLWSDWDVALHHRRRYVKSELLKLAAQTTVETLRCAYINSVMLPVISLIRAWRRLVPPRPGSVRSEDTVPAAWLNSLLHQFMVIPACWNWLQPPFGVSLLAVLHKNS